MVLNPTSVGVGRRNRSSLCMCSKNCIFDIIWSEKNVRLILLKFGDEMSVIFVKS